MNENYPIKQVYAHRLKAEEFYNRKIQPEEVVHHLDGNKKNYRKENLIIMKKKDHEIYELHLIKIKRRLRWLKKENIYKFPAKWSKNSEK